MSLSNHSPGSPCPYPLFLILTDLTVLWRPPPLFLILTDLTVLWRTPPAPPLVLILTDLTVIWLSPSAPPPWFWFWLTWLSFGCLPLPLPSCLVLQLLGHLIKFVLELLNLLTLWPAFYRRLVTVFGQFPREQNSQFYKMFNLKLCTIKTYKYTWPMLSRKILYWTNTYLF